MPSTPLDFQQARAHHLLFKSRLRAILYGQTSGDIDSVKSQYDCPLGKWIYGHALITYNSVDEVVTLEKVHAQIHTLARELIVLYETDQVEKARRGLADLEAIADNLVDLLQRIEDKVKPTPDTAAGLPIADDYAHQLAMLSALLAKNQQLDQQIKQQSAELVKNEALLRTITTAAPVGLWMSDADGDITFVNQTWVDWTGRLAEAHLGQHWTNSILAEDRQRTSMIYEQALADRSEYDVEFRIRRPDAALRWCRSAGRPWYTASGDFGGYAGSVTDTTEQRKADQTVFLKSEQERQALHDFFMQAPAAMCILRGPTHVYELVNDAYIELMGNRDYIGKPVRKIIPEAEGQSFFDLLDHVFTTGEPFSGREMRMLIDIGAGQTREAYLNFTYQLIVNPQHEPDGVLVLVYEVTDQVLAHQKVAESRERFRSVLEAIAQITWTTLPTGEFTYYNQRWYDYTGLTDEQTKRWGWQTVVHPDDLTQTLRAYQQALETGAIFERENRYRRSADGQYRWHLNRAVPLRDEAGTITLWVGTATDIHEQKQMETALEERVAERTNELQRVSLTLQSMLDGSLNGILLLEPITNEAGTITDFRIKAANPAVRPLTGISHDITGLTMQEAYPAYKQSGFHNLYLNALRTGRPVRSEYYYEDDRLAGWFDTSVVRQATGLVVTFTSTTEARRSQQALRQSVDDLHRSNDNLQQFAYVASHDLQEPLRKIQSFGSLLKSSYAPLLDQSGQDMIDRMESASARMSLLIRDLLEYSRLTTRHQKSSPQSLDQTVAGVLATLDLVIQEKGAVIDVAQLGTVPGDATQLAQLFQNLLTNALKFSKPTLIPYIQISSHALRRDDLPAHVQLTSYSDEYCVIRIQDNGIGFAPHQSERIFGTFQRLHGRNQYPGTGIGLSIAKKVVENHRGAIVAESQPDQGALFTVYLPTT